MKNMASSVQRGTARRPERSRWLTRFLPVALLLGLFTGGLGATLGALPAGALPPTAVTDVNFTSSSFIAFETGTAWTAWLRPAGPEACTRAATS